MYAGCAALVIGLCALSMATDAGAADADDRPVVVLDTTAGPITLELDRVRAPITVDNFLKYVDAGFYNGLVFHRVIPGFMVMIRPSEDERVQIQGEKTEGRASRRSGTRRRTG